MFSRRSTKAELIDDLQLSGETMDQTLAELKVINTWLGGNQVTTKALDYFRRRPQYWPFFQRPVTIADIGCGGGDILRLMADWAQKRRVRVTFTGVDANAYVTDYAAENCRDYSQISFRQADIFSPAFAQQPYDLITCSLFCHHFTDEQLIVMFRQLYGQAKMGVIINDLHRHPLAYYSIKALTAAFSKSYLVRNDGPLSVLRAFRRPELKRILAEAGITSYRLRWMWAFRWQLILFKEEDNPTESASGI